MKALAFMAIILMVSINIVRGESANNPRQNTDEHLDFKNYLITNPGLANYLSNKHNAAVSADDIDPLREVRLEQEKRDLARVQTRIFAAVISFLLLAGVIVAYLMNKEAINKTFRVRKTKIYLGGQFLWAVVVILYVYLIEPFGWRMSVDDRIKTIIIIFATPLLIAFTTKWARYITRETKDD